jgi:hypothetical protein
MKQQKQYHNIVYYYTINQMNLQNSSNKIYGIPDGVAYGQFERQDELNTRLLERNVPDRQQAPVFTPRMVSTRYSRFPLVNLRTQPKEQLNQYLDHSVESNFTPMNTKGHVSGFVNNIQTESVLRNQHFALQRGGDQGVYIPNSSSDLYRVSVPSSTTRKETQPFPTLFQQPTFQPNRRFQPQESNIGNDLFLNNTRVQLRNTLVQK